MTFEQLKMDFGKLERIFGPSNYSEVNFRVR